MLAVKGPNFRQDDAPRFSPRFRRARESDRDRLIELEGFAYPSEVSLVERERAVFHPPLGSLSDFVVGEIAGEIVCQAFLFRLVVHYGGQAVKTGGIASVAVAPEARGRGLATAMMEHIHSVARRRGMPLTMLYAFRQGFYARLGYAPASSRKRLCIAAKSIPRAWNAPVRRAKGADRTTIEHLYRDVARTRSGVHERPRALWDLRFARLTRMYLLTDDGAGYVAFQLRQGAPHAETTLVVDELVARTPEARRALLGALGRMRDQVTTIELEVAEDDPLERALIDADAHRHGDDDVEHDLGRIVGGPLVRITDPELAFTARGYVANGDFAVELQSEQGGAPEDARYEVRVRSGRATVARLATPSGRAANTRTKNAPRRATRATLRTTRSTLAALLYGGLRVHDAVALGQAEADAPAADRIDAVLRLPPVVPFDAF